MRELDKALKEKETPAQVPLHLPLEEEIVEEVDIIKETDVKSITIDI
jgi:hypothetical protein